MQHLVFTSVGGGLYGDRKQHKVVHSLCVAYFLGLAALYTLLHNEAEHVAGVLWASAIPLEMDKYDSDKKPMKYSVSKLPSFIIH